MLPAGIALAWISIGFIALGLFTGGPALLLGVLGLLLLPVCRWLAGAQLSGLEFSRRIPRRVFSGEQFTVESTAHNTNRYIHASALVISDAMADATSRDHQLAYLENNSSAELRWFGRLFQRGWNDERGITVSSRWPMGLFEAKLSTRFQITDSSTGSGILVVPRPLKPEFLTRTLERLEAETVLNSVTPPDAPTEFRSLREFRSGDALKMIHWPASSRSGQLFIRETDPPVPKPSVQGLLIHSFAPAGDVIRNDQFEIMLRIATGLVLHFQKQETSLLFAASFTDQLIQHIPFESGYASVLNQIARSPVRYRTDLESTLSDLEDMNHCDQVFVLGCSPRSTWESEIKNVLPSSICIDCESVSSLTQKPILKRRVILT